MKPTRILLIILGILVIALIILAWLPPLELAGPPTHPSITTLPADQTEFLRQLELGYAAEALGQVEHAQAAYQEAALAGDEQLAAAGQENYVRLVRLQKNPLYVLQTGLQWLKSPLIWLGLILVIGLVALLYWPRPAAYRVAPFTNLTKDPAGDALQPFVLMRLTELRDGYTTAQQELSLDLQALNLVQDRQLAAPLTDLINLFGDLKLGPAALPLDKVKSLFERWRDRNLNILGGTCYQYGGQLYLDAELVRDGQPYATFYLRSDSTDQPVENLAGDLVYRFLFSLTQENVPFQSSDALQTWSEGLLAYQRRPADPDGLAAYAGRLAAVQAAEPGNRLVSFLLGMLHYRIEDYPAARHVFGRLVQSDGTLDDLSLAAACRLGQAYYLDFQPGGFAKAIQYFETVRQSLAGPELNERQQQLAALAECGLATIWAQQLFKEDLEKGHAQKQVDLIEETCKAALQKAGSSPEVKAAAHMALGIAYKNFQNPGRALQEFSAAVDVRRDYPAALIYQAATLLQILHPEDHAERLDDRILKAKGEEQQRLLARWDEQAEEAAGLLNESLATGLPGTAYARKKLVELLIYWGRVYAKLNRLDDALACYTEATLADPGCVEAWDNIAYRIVESDQKDAKLLSQAENAANQAIKLAVGDPQEAHARFTLASLYLAQGRYTLVRQEVEKALALSPGAKDRQSLERLRARLNDMQAGKETGA